MLAFSSVVYRVEDIQARAIELEAQRDRLFGRRQVDAGQSEPGQWESVATDLDASLLSTDVADGFIGATFGPYAFRS